MNKRTGLVFKGFLELTTSEKSDLIKAMNDYLERSTEERTELAEEYKRVSLGPLSREVCPCCGK